MVKDIIMPRLGDTSTEGWVDTWHKSVGDEVEMGDVICTISMDKAAFEIESPYDGTVHEILVGEDVTVNVGTAIARIKL
jgi:2-oxoglutarate dehydrogenase E2 component (dihydrolipoamide succinyltransferase)